MIDWRTATMLCGVAVLAAAFGYTGYMHFRDDTCPRGLCVGTWQPAEPIWPAPKRLTFGASRLVCSQLPATVAFEGRNWHITTCQLGKDRQ
ncbi:MAG: hypothetical protein ACREF4_03630 [Gammaproteobacteria bacterium]